MTGELGPLSKPLPSSPSGSLSLNPSAPSDPMSFLAREKISSGSLPYLSEGVLPPGGEDIRLVCALALALVAARTSATLANDPLVLVHSSSASEEALEMLRALCRNSVSAS